MRGHREASQVGGAGSTESSWMRHHSRPFRYLDGRLYQSTDPSTAMSTTAPIE